MGITADRKCVTLDEEVYNNRDRQVPLTPSDIPKIFTAFLEKNRRTWGFARDVYIDSADQATILECQKFGRLTGSIYNFIPAFKKTKIIDRIHLQSAWLAAGDFISLSIARSTQTSLTYTVGKRIRLSLRTATTTLSIPVSMLGSRIVTR